MSKFQNYVPQSLPVYKGLPGYSAGASSDTHYQNYKQWQAKDDLDTFRYTLPHDGTNYVIPPMLVKRPAGGDPITAFGLYNLDGSAAQLFISMPTTSVSDLDDTPTFEALVIEGQRRAVGGTSVGTPYYFAFNDGTNYWYTEVFYFATSGTIPSSGAHLTLPNECAGVEWIQLIWGNSGCILSETYPDSLSFVLNLQAVVSRPTYKYILDSEDDYEGGEITLFQRMEKRWEFFIVGPEYLADCLTSIQMFSEVGIVFQYGDTVSCDDVKVEAEPQERGLHRITFTFTTSFLSKTACCGA